ncbi:pyocin knob domain-containing protein [Phytobacter massiliensis]|uniref:pyocin knob domain-containing protein n=1 Tax=Phytobacter massiliensis TaxID=1485952 RepID=UPI0002D8BA42|nr:pyocin knob domain-containing protein [Phytobacter massiliensis]
MSNILTGNLFKLSYSEDPANNLPIGIGVIDFTNIAAMPTLQIDSQQLDYETYDSEYKTVLLSSMSIQPFDIVVNYVPDEASTVFLDSKAKSRNEFQVILNYEQNNNSVSYAIVSGTITATSTAGSKDSVVQKTYTFTPYEEVVSLRSMATLNPLYEGNYGVGSNGVAVPQYEPVTPTGNSFIKVPASQSGNPASADMMGIGLIDGSTFSSIAMTKTGTLNIYAKNGSTAWTRILTSSQIASQYLPLTGGTVTGALTVTSALTLGSPLSIANGGTGNTTGLAASATKLATSRTFITNLASTTATGFDGTANNSHGVTGVLPVTNGGTGSNAAITAAYNIGAQPIRGGIPTAGINFDTYGPTAAYLGQWAIISSSQYNGSTNIPEAITGILDVMAAGAFAGTQRYTTSAGTVYVRTLGATWDAANPVWREWNQVGYVTAASSGNFSGDVNTLTSVGRFNIATAATNIPVQQPGLLLVERFAVSGTQVLQTFKTLVTNASYANRTFTRTLNGGVWTSWNELGNVGDNSALNYVRNNRFLSGGYLPSVGNPGNVTFTYLDSSDSSVPVGCTGQRVAVITKNSGANLHNLVFGVNNDDNSNNIPVMPGDIIDYQVGLAATGLTDTAQLRVVLSVYNGNTLLSNVRVSAYDPTVSGWRINSGSYTVPANATRINAGVWLETTAPVNCKVFITEPVIMKRLPQYAGTGVNTDIKQITGLTTPLAPNMGGTGGTGGALTLPIANFNGDANNAITAGIYSVSSSTSNLPLVANGIMIVTTIASGTAIIQDFSSVALGSGTVSRAWRRQGNVSSGVTTWKAWMSITQLPTEGATGDLNTFTNPGTYYGGSYTNGPSAMGNASCMLIVQSTGAGGNMTQLAQYTSSNRTFTRTYAGGTWNDWLEIANESNSMSAPTTALGTTDLNIYGGTINAVYYQTSDANATVARNYPEASAGGTLFVTRSTWGGQQMYVTRKGTMYLRANTGTWTGSGPWSAWAKVYTAANTTVDANGFIKTASPIVKLFSTGDSELNEESMGATSTRISEGVYKIEGVLGLNSDTSWSGTDGGFEIPIDRNKQPRLWIDYEVEEDGSIVVKTFHRTHPNSPEFAQNNIDGYSNGDPIDIPVDSFISVRVEMPVSDKDEPIDTDDSVPEDLPEDDVIIDEPVEPLPDYEYVPVVIEPEQPQYYESTDDKY